jgi:outer membrane lipoprotein-sorting protein
MSPAHPRAGTLALLLAAAGAAAGAGTAAAPTPTPAPTPAAAVPTAPAAAPADSGPVLAQLMQLLSRQQHAEADFEERQYLSVLTQPLVSSGTLIYRAPGHLEQRTLKPRRQTMVLDHGTLLMQVGAHRRSVALADYPQLAPLIDSIRATLAGDQTALEQRFHLQLYGALDHWRLQLQPRTTQPANITQIDIRGQQAQILEVQIRQADGDHAVMHIRPHP